MNSIKLQNIATASLSQYERAHLTNLLVPWMNKMWTFYQLWKMILPCAAVEAVQRVPVPHVLRQGLVGWEHPATNIAQNWNFNEHRLFNHNQVAWNLKALNCFSFTFINPLVQLIYRFLAALFLVSERTEFRFFSNHLV